MKRCGLDFATLVTVLLTAFVLTKSGWLSAARSAAHRAPEVRVPVKAASAFASEAANRFRRAQPTHWRACLLQH